jgi:hypothetical protein
VLSLWNRGCSAPGTYASTANPRVEVDGDMANTEMFGHHAVFNEADECACSDIETRCVLGKASNVLVRSLRHGDRAAGWL